MRKSGLDLLNKLKRNDTLMRPKIYKKLKLMNEFVKKKYPLLITDAKPQKLMGCYSQNFFDSLKLGYDRGHPYYSIITKRGRYRGLHIYLTIVDEKWDWIYRERFIAHRLAKNGYCVIFCKTTEKIQPYIIEYLHGPHKLIQKKCDKIFRGVGVDQTFVLNQITKIEPTELRKQWFVEFGFHKYVIKRLRNEFPAAIIDGKAQGNLDKVFHRHSNTIGYTNGIFDIIIWGKRKTIFIELKVGGNDLTVSQKKVRELLKGISYVHAIKFNGTKEYEIDNLIKHLKTQL